MLFYIIYPFFYCLSLLPWPVMYLISDGMYVLIYYVIGYRKKVVMDNLLIAFPEKTKQERTRIAKDFYKKFTDTFIETIKLTSVSDSEFQKRFSSNIEVVNELYAAGNDVQMYTGHFFNWEFANLGFSRNAKFPLVFVYLPLSNKAFNRVIVKLRGRYGSIMLSASEFKNRFKEFVNGHYALGLAADQAPSSPDKAYWLPFFDRMTPFFSGPENGAKKNNMYCVFGHFYAERRGYFKFDFEVMTLAPNEFETGKLTQLYVTYLERAIRKIPANYLWSHRRWKHRFDEEKYGHLVIK